MIDTAVSVEPPWQGEWRPLAGRAVLQAIALTPHAGFAAMSACVEVSVRLTSDAEVRILNRQYRHKDAPTNVLSFPMVQPDLLESLADTDDSEILLGDIVLAHETCVREAEAAGVTLEAHAAHLIVHGTLHLLSHDHMDEGEADTMEQIEREAMAALGLHDPYPVCP